MIVKSLSRKSGITQIVNYLFKDHTKLESERFAPLVIRHNIRSRKQENIVKEIKANNSLRTTQRKNRVEVHHSILSFGKKDNEKLNNTILKDIAKQYIKLNGKDKQYLITSHIEKAHIHLHAVVGGTKYKTGEANRLSKKEFQELKVKLQKYQLKKYPELENSIPQHQLTKGKLYTKDIRETKKNLLQSHLDIAFKTSNNVIDFLDQIKQLGHEPYYRNNELTGVKFEGTGAKFRLSKLGYDKEKLEMMELENEDQKELEVLESIRDNARGNSRENSSKSRFIEEEKDEHKEDLDSELQQEIEDDYER